MFLQIAALIDLTRSDKDQELHVHMYVQGAVNVFEQIMQYSLIKLISGFYVLFSFCSLYDAKCIYLQVFRVDLINHTEKWS